MEILIVGGDTPGSLERYCARALGELGHTVTFYDSYERLHARMRFSTVPVLAEVERGLYLPGYNRRLVKHVNAVRPDVVFVFRGTELQPATLAALRKGVGRPLLINWNPDSPFDFATTNTNPALVASIPLYDVYFIWDRDLFGPLREAGAQRVEYLPFGYAPHVHHPVDVPLDLDVCFVGAYTSERAALLGAVAQQGHHLGIWGPNWHALPGQSPLRTHLREDWVTEEGMSAVFSRSRIVLNVIREQNGQAHNMRTFEAPATRSLMLSTYTRDQSAWFPEDEAAAYYRTPDEMLTQIRTYLADEAARQRLAQRAYERVMNGQHTYADRMRQLIDVLKTL